MTIEVNSNFPAQTLRLVVNEELQEVDSSEYLADKKVMLVGGQLLATRSVARYVCHAVSVTGSLRSAAQLKAASMIMPNWGKCIALPTRTCGLLSLS